MLAVRKCRGTCVAQSLKVMWKKSVIFILSPDRIFLAWREHSLTPSIYLRWHDGNPIRANIFAISKKISYAGTNRREY